jgi:hypothetical protein
MLLCRPLAGGKFKVEWTRRMRRGGGQDVLQGSEKGKSPSRGTYNDLFGYFLKGTYSTQIHFDDDITR